MTDSSISEISSLSHYFSHSKSSQEKRKKKKTLIETYEDEQNYAPWFRALSSSQLDAIESLQRNIKDDAEQDTTFRCRTALLRLGLVPIETNSNIALVIKLSQGNDMAFLWFLMELFYKDVCDQCTHKKTMYNVNEQLMLSAVAHLDMVTTLKELDKLLPKQYIPPKPEPIKKKNGPKKKYPSPYLEPLTVPNYSTGYPKRPPKLNPPHLGRYQYRLNNPDYVVPNEANRWYAVPIEQQKALDFDIDTRGTEEKFASTVVKDVIDKILDERDENGSQISEALCPTHKELKRIESRNRKLALKKEIRHILETNVQKKHRRTRIIRQLEDKVQKIITQIRHDEELQKMTGNQVCKTVNEGTEGKCETTEGSTVSIAPEVNEPEGVEHVIDFGHTLLPKPSEIYFQAAKQNQPYFFDYSKIFSDDLTNLKNPVKNAIRKVLNVKEFRNEDEAINNWCLNEWKMNVETKKRMSKKNSVEKPDNIYYNPRDDDLMENLLLGALNKMREDPKYVLAAMPNAHRHPTLIDFVRTRYGLVYTREEREKTLGVSMKVMEKLRQTEYGKNPPTQQDLGSRKSITYNCRDHLLKKSNYIRSAFYHRMKTNILEDFKLYWFAMEPGECAKRPRDTYYAYNPAREYDILAFKPWKVNEYTDVAMYHEKRVQLKKEEEKNRK